MTQLKVIILGLLYIFIVHYAYVAYIHPTFEYAHYTYLEHSLAELIVTYHVILLPLITYRPSANVAQGVAALIYSLSYVPIQLSLLFTIDRDYSQVLIIQGMLAFSMSVIFLVSKTKSKTMGNKLLLFRRMDMFVIVITLAALVILFAANYAHMRFVSFGDVYELRFQAVERNQGVLNAYLTSWLSYCFISYLFARGLIHKKSLFLAGGLFASVALYMSTGSKAAILLLPISIALLYIWGNGDRFLCRLLFIMTLFIAFVIFAVPNDGIGMWLKSITLVRVLGTAGWIASKYLEYFTEHGFTYYSHIGPINALVDIYPYGNLLLGQEIGLAYSGSEQANFNGGFWASDGFAALGPIGVIVITPFVAGLLYLINSVMSNIDSRFSLVWMVGFLIALLNVPFSTALLSGGGVIILAQAWWLRASAMKHS